MKGQPQVLAVLNTVLTRKLTAINQYFLHARMYRNLGFEPLNKVIYKASIKEMVHADEIIERILLLEGLPNLQELGKLYIGERPEEMLKLDHKVQAQDIDVIKQAIEQCEQAEDFVSRELLAGILEQQEEHWDWLETQLDVIGKIGIQRYLQTQIDEEA
ncbi:MULTISPECIES: bacterioferritin [Gammaproteobacteria]|uniref:bacterioferritin n=1 Tax=Gammaproteobacteria TaxID=1236 RepID=UPI000DCF8881|nr:MULTISPECIES: bacterioferritin [Gammaproteobacteria]RTE87759.1 bacterioferritin [Aliidiomarina sp. B3213]TCZ92459.1 bacterioferritin [Lysobacter sp. N42]